MHVVGLWRYPVKSMQGEALKAVEVGVFGIAGDRRFGVQVEESGRILTAKRDGRLLTAGAATTDPVRISLPNGDILDRPGPSTDSALSSWLQRSVRLVEAGDDEGPTFESQVNDLDDASASATWQGRPGPLVDSSPVHLLTTASLRAMALQRPDLDWCAARFRPNVLVEAAGDERVEDAWVGRRCSVGNVQLEIIKLCERCVMITRPQPGGLGRQLGALTHLSQVADSCLGVLARVERPGTVALGALVSLE
ncbi:MAG: MOSC N-terminal beta barrel domain-containing protein [Actinomycetota bacterium]|nr:MOSC N-terminal beta barrel domain-containing protein [Actinomycetota bacterium]